MSDARKSLPFEATVTLRIDEEIEDNGAIQDFMRGLTGYEAERFRQILHHVGYTSFIDGFSRPTPQEGLSLEHQSLVLNHETDLFLRGASE